MEVISVDSDRSGIKGIGSTERIYFKALKGEWRQLRNGRELGIGDFEVEYNGEKFFVGQIAEESYDGNGMMLRYKAHIDTKVMVLTAVHRLVNDGARVFLITGQPLSFHNDHDKQKMKQLIIGNHSLTVNSITKQFFIERVEVTAEGATVAWSIGRRRIGRFHVVDIGSRTVNYATANGPRWVDKESDSLDYGWETFNGKESQFARVVISDLARVLRPLGPIVLVGGKECPLSYLKQYHDDIELHPDALFANAQAFFELGVMANEREAKAR